MPEIKGTVFDVERFAVHDGPGIRTIVFMKGCPLRCLWCHNPEGLSRELEVIWYENRCIGCNQCLKICPADAVTLAEGKRTVNKEACTLCGKCVEACPALALVFTGRTVTVDALLEEVQRDEPFYLQSGGGVTVSGGEPLAQPRFVSKFLSECQGQKIHTAIETCGYARWEVFRAVLRKVDLVLYDLKQMDAEKHREFTGASNRLILGNAEKLRRLLKKDTVIRVPVIPGHNDSTANVRRIAEFVAPLKVIRVDLLPYHQLAEPKYVRLGLPYRLKGTKPPPEKHLKELREIVEAQGVKCQVGG